MLTELESIRAVEVRSLAQFRDLDRLLQRREADLRASRKKIDSLREKKNDLTTRLADTLRDKLILQRAIDNLIDNKKGENKVSVLDVINLTKASESVSVSLDPDLKALKITPTEELSSPLTPVRMTGKVGKKKLRKPLSQMPSPSKHATGLVNLTNVSMSRSPKKLFTRQ